MDVVGLGPGGRDWLTPQAQAVLAAADDIVGYAPYVDRVPPNPRQRRHGSDNRVEAQRAEFALDLALRGRRVAVVSSGDPGVFAMASVVLEAAAGDSRFAAVPVSVVPGVTAAQAVASLAGAPLGHDYVMLSLSDRLKPWDVIARRLTAAAEGDFAIAIYNPASQSRRQQLADARDLLLAYRRRGHAGRSRPRRRHRRAAGHGDDPGRVRPRAGRHALPGHHRLQPVPPGPRQLRRRPGHHPAPLPGLAHAISQDRSLRGQPGWPSAARTASNREPSGPLSSSTGISAQALSGSS